MSTELNPTTGLRIDLEGPTVEFLTSPQEASIDFCVLKGVIPPGVSVPLHSHPDPNRLAGEIHDGLTQHLSAICLQLAGVRS